jgi:uncharacterized integral membrane protein
MRWLRRTLGLALLVAVLVGGWRFAGRNAQPIGVDLLFATLPEEPVWLLLAAAFAAGALAAALVALFGISRAKLVARRYRKLAGKLEAEVHQLRNLPLAQDDERAPRGSSGRAPELREGARGAGRSG